MVFELNSVLIGTEEDETIVANQAFSDADIYFPDPNSDPLTMFPRLTIKDNVNLMGSYNGGSNGPKAYTEFKLKIDFFKIHHDIVTMLQDDVGKYDGFDCNSLTDNPSSGHYDNLKSDLLREYATVKNISSEDFIENYPKFVEEVDEYIEKLKSSSVG